MDCRVPSISVLLPVRNAEQDLPAALQSLYRQTCADWELVAVNDGSSDQSGVILDKAAIYDHRVRVIHQPAEGLINALNRGLAACRSDLIARMDADDICHPRRLDCQLNHFRSQPETTLLGCQIRHFPRSEVRGGFLAYEAWQNELITHDEIVKNCYVESPFAHPSVMFRRTAVEKLGCYREMGWAEDYDLWLRLLHNGARFAKLPETLLFWRDRPKRLSRTGNDYTLDAFRRCKLHFLLNDYLKGVKNVTLWGAGQEGKMWRRLLVDNGINVTRWIEVDRRKIGQTIHQAPVVGIDQLAPGQEKMLITIGARGARSEVRNYAASRQLIEGVDFVCVT